MEHRYSVTIEWTGDLGQGTASYRGYRRDHTIVIEGKPTLLASSDPTFRGDPGRYNPEELLVASLSSCHLLWYLHLCADAGVVVTGYRDRATGRMTTDATGAGQFVEVILEPTVTVASADMVHTARRLHEDANRNCFIARSVKFPVRHRPTVDVG